MTTLFDLDDDDADAVCDALAQHARESADDLLQECGVAGP